MRPFIPVITPVRKRARYWLGRGESQDMLALWPLQRHRADMNANTTDTGATREARLAAKLRENLRRRKAQGRAQAQERDPPDIENEAESSETGLSKSQ